ncbi:MAG: outer membrane protein assembly factor BamB family protein [Planctomycetota bacterium]|jgi:outer membrane protein assembly factor BamB
MKTYLYSVLVIGALAADTAAQPAITGINDAQRTRSGRVSIEGTGFGASGEVVIAGLEAWTSTWTDTRIVAYVPEAAALGVTSMHVISGGESSNAVGLTVLARQPDGRVQWTFETDGQNLRYRPAIGPDGTLYLHSNNATDGIIYAVSPDGALQWIQTVPWYAATPPTTGPDGTLYVATGSTVFAISPQGEILWSFDDPTAQHVQVAPTIGPDGLLYGACDVGIGAFALDPADGSLLWSNTGDPFMFDVGNPFGTEARFGPSQPGGALDQFYVHMDGHDKVSAFSLDGDQVFAASAGGSISHEPEIGSDGTIYLTFGTDGAWMLKAIDPDTGQQLWFRQPEVGNTMSEVAIGPDDTLYYNASGRLEAVDPSTQSLRWIDRHFEVLGWPTVTHDGASVIVDGVPTYGQPGFIRAYDAASGAVQWQIDLPGTPYPGFRVLGTHHARVTPDSSTAYVSTLTVENESPFTDPHAFLYAIALGEPTGPAGDVDGNGVVNFADVLGAIAAWGPCNGACPADVDGNGAVGFGDILVILANWSA